MSTQPKKNGSAGPGYLEVILIAVIVAAVAVIGYDRLYAQKITVFDLKGQLRSQNALMMTGEITQEQWKAGLDSLEQTLNREAAANRNHVIVLKEVVLRNGKEFSIE